MKAPPPSSGARLAGIEGLRALAAGSIVLLHVWGFSMPHREVLGSGHRLADAFSTLAVGVTLFFTLSGFLLYRPFAASIARGERSLRIPAYARNRVLRIVPAYWVILALTLAIGAVNIRHVDGTISYVGRLLDPFSLFQVGFLLQNYRPSTVDIGIGPAWSLAVEAVFYCVLPLLVCAAAFVARRTTTRRQRVLVLLGPPVFLLLLGLSGKYAAHLLPGSPTEGFEPNWHSVIERSFWAQADLFSFGMIVAVLHTEVADGQLHLPLRWRWIAVVAGLLVFAPCAWTMHQGEQSYLPQNTGEALGLSLLFAAIVIPGFASNRSRAIRCLESRPLVAAGVVSYSLFLWHAPIIHLLESYGLTLGGGWWALLVNLIEVAVVAGTLSALTYRYVERPALRRKRSTRQAGAPRKAPEEAPPAPAIARPT
jgi:peptidoglycan/LPS O-acetylase OafA/YrhL